MRLLHTETLQFSEYVSPNDAPPYIIASHRWLHDEVSYWEFVKDRANADPEIRKKAGMDKILRFCGYINLWGSWPAETKIPQHVWIDTCCINKDSSAELQEAITSMFEWYARAWCCLAWLHDVKGDAASLEGSKDFSDSVWFTRGMRLRCCLAVLSLTVGTRVDLARASCTQDRHLPRSAMATIRTQVVHGRPPGFSIKGTNRVVFARTSS